MVVTVISLLMLPVQLAILVSEVTLEKVEVAEVTTERQAEEQW